MALNDFFRINFPYGIARDAQGGWYAFNREYMPLGWHTKDQDVFNATMAEEVQKISCNYKGLTERLLLELSDGPDYVDRDDKGEISRIWFYGDGSNPNDDLKSWEPYLRKMKRLGKLKVKDSQV